MFKRSALWAFFFLLTLSVFADPKDSVRVEVRNGNKFFVHRVVKSESLQSLATRYGVDESQILSSNPLLTDKVYPGQIVKIPVNEQKYGEVAPTPVVPLTESRLPLAKSLPPPPPAERRISDGQSKAVQEVVEPKVEVPESKMPAPKPVVATPVLDKNKYQVYVVVSPQTVQHLSESFAVDVNDVIALNNLKNYNLKEGQRVKIPVYHAGTEIAKADPAPAPAPTPAPVAKAEPAPMKFEAATHKREEPKPTPAPEPIVAKETKAEPKPEPKPEPKVEPKQEPVKENVVAQVPPQEPAKPKPSPLPKVAPKQTAPLATAEPKQESVQQKESKAAGSKAGVAYGEDEQEAYFDQPDSLMMAEMKKKRKAYLAHLDSAYIVPGGVTYKVFDYKYTDYQFDLFTLKMAEENAIDVNTVNQRKGVGDKNFTHVVKKGETLQSIAKKYKVSATDIINWNGLLSYRVREGQELVMNSDRANTSAYLRTIPKQNEMSDKANLKFEKIAGFCRYDFKGNGRGVYINGVEKGSFVYIINTENFEEYYARVLGPLPAKTPPGVVLIIDHETARELKTDLSLFHVEVYYNIITQAANK